MKRITALTLSWAERYTPAGSRLVDWSKVLPVTICREMFISSANPKSGSAVAQMTQPTINNCRACLVDIRIGSLLFKVPFCC